MIVRNPTQLCLLCLFRKATKTGSHFVPAGILKKTIGKRDNEEAFTIDPEATKTSTHFGRSNLKNTNPNPTPNPHVADYIFCPVCEEALGNLESEIIPFLDQATNTSTRQGFEEKEISSDIRVIELKKANFNVFSLFVYSLVWRISLQHRLDKKTIVVSAPFEEVLRNLLNINLQKSADELKNLNLDVPFRYSIITCLEIDDTTATFVNPNNILTNPYLFYVGTFIVLIYHDACAENGTISTLPKEIINNSLFIDEVAKKIRLVLVSKSIWDTIQYKMVDYARKEYTQTMVVRLAQKRNITHVEAAEILNNYSTKIQEEITDAGEYFKEMTRFYEEQLNM